MSHFKELEWLGRILTQILIILLKYFLSVMCVCANTFIRLLIKERHQYNFWELKKKKSEKWKLLSSVQCSATAWTVAPQAPLSMGILQARILEWVVMPSSGVSSQPMDRIQAFRIAGGFFTHWATREAQVYYGGWPVPSSGIFPTQKSNRGLRHCRQILYQLNY